jgi:hypothetical protein
VDHSERARLFRERAEQLRRIANESRNSADRSVLEQAAREYEEMAEAESTKGRSQP